MMGAKDDVLTCKANTMLSGNIGRRRRKKKTEKENEDRVKRLRDKMITRKDTQMILTYTHTHRSMIISI